MTAKVAWQTTAEAQKRLGHKQIPEAFAHKASETLWRAGWGHDTGVDVVWGQPTAINGVQALVIYVAAEQHFTINVYEVAEIRRVRRLMLAHLKANNLTHKKLKLRPYVQGLWVNIK